MRFAAWLLAATLLPGAGCVASPSGNVPSRDDSTTFLFGTVLDEENRPVEGALITTNAVDGMAVTGEAGAYELAGLPLGRWSLRAEHAAYFPALAEVEIVASQAVRHDFHLVVRPTAVPFNQTLLFQGSYDCGWEFLILGGDCLVLYENLTGQPDPFTNESYAFRVPVGPAWQSLHVSLRWQDAANNQLDGMRLSLEHGNGSKTGHSIKVARADGNRQPLELWVRQGETHPQAEAYPGTRTLARISDEGETLQLRVFPRGKFLNVFGQVCSDGKCFWGIGVGFGLRFEAAVTIEYLG